MSNVKVNGNTYSGVTSVKLPLADGNGYATYTEGAVTDNMTNALLDGSISGNITNEEILTVSLNCFLKCSVGTLNFPNAVKMRGSAQGIVAENILLPKVSSIDKAAVPAFRDAVISGTVDLSGMPYMVGMGLNQTFYGATIGTVKLGKTVKHNGVFQNATVTNVVWGLDSFSNEQPDIAGIQGLGSTGAKITNAYVADSVYEQVKALMDNGTLTTVTNLYKISQWRDA